MSVPDDPLREKTDTIIRTASTRMNRCGYSIKGLRKRGNVYRHVRVYEWDLYTLNAMFVINSHDELKDLIADTKKRIVNIRKNNTQMISAFDTAVTEGRVYGEVYDDGLLVYVSQNTFTDVYYYWKRDALLPIITGIVKPVISCTVRAGSADDEEKFLLSSGFELYRTNVQVKAEIKSKYTDNIYSSDYAVITKDTKEYYDQAAALWEEYLDQFDVPFEHLHPNDNHHLICAVNQNNKVIGVHWWQNHGRTSEGRHTAVSADCRKKGIASSLIKQWLCDAGSAGALNAETWICTENCNSLHVYSRAGFTMNQRIAKQYTPSNY